MMHSSATAPPLQIAMPHHKKRGIGRNAVQLALSGIFVFVQVVVNIIKSC